MQPSPKPLKFLIISVLEEEAAPLIAAFNLEQVPCSCIFADLYEQKFLTPSSNSIENPPKPSISLLKPRKDPKFGVDAFGLEVSAILAYFGITTETPDFLINAGTSGGIVTRSPEENLGKDLKIGDVCVANGGVRFYERECAENSRFFEYSQGNYEVFQLPREFLEKISVKCVSFGSSGSFSEEQARVAVKKGLDVIDNEAASIGQVCYLLGKTRFLPVKVVSDVNSGDKYEQMQMFENSLKEVSLKLAEKVQEIVRFLSE